AITQKIRVTRRGAAACGRIGMRRTRTKKLTISLVDENRLRANDAAAWSRDFFVVSARRSSDALAWFIILSQPPIDQQKIVDAIAIQQEVGGQNRYDLEAR